MSPKLLPGLVIKHRSTHLAIIHQSYQTHQYSGDLLQVAANDFLLSITSLTLLR